MTKRLSKMERDGLQDLLERYSELSAIEKKIGGRGIIATIATTNTYDDRDCVSATVDSSLAKQIVSQQRAKVEKQLATYGVVPK